MANSQTLDKAFNVIMRRLVASGRAPHYAELAAALGCSVEEGRQALREVMASGPPQSQVGTYLLPLTS